MNVVQSDRAGRLETRGETRASRDRGRKKGRTARRGPRSVKSAEERRTDILEAALGLFRSKGFAETTVSDIASEAGMATGTVYLYFPSKEHVLQGLHEWFSEQTLAAVTEAAVDAVDRAGRGEQVDYRDTVDVILDALAETFISNRDLAIVCTRYRPELMDPEPHSVGHSSLVTQALAEGVRLGLIHTSDPEMTGYLFDAAISYNLHTHIAFGDPPDLQRLIAAAKEMFHKTLALPAEQGAPAKRSGDGSRRRRAAR